VTKWKKKIGPDLYIIRKTIPADELR